MTQKAGPDNPDAVIPLYADSISIDRREVEGDTIRLTVQTHTREQVIDEQLAHTRVEIERIPIGRTIDAAPPVRTEGDTIIIPVIEEIAVVERRLVLKEEIVVRRVRTAEPYREKVSLREQEALVERTDQNGGPLPTPNDRTIKQSEECTMTNETIVAVYDTKAHAAAAVDELENTGISSSAINQHAKSGMRTGSSATAATAPPRKPGFWATLLGGEPERSYDTTVYDRSLESGAVVVTVQVEEQYLTTVMDVLERHNPVDIDERGAGYSAGQMGAPLASGTAAPLRTGPAERSADEQSMQLAEETLAVGKRAINRGTTRVRRYVVETPVEEQVNLRSESVSVERRPIADGRPVTDANFTDKVVEVTETDEEPVISKQARIKEEVVIHKDATERTETVRDTVRREEAEVTKDAADGTTARSGLTARPAIDADEAKR